MKDLKSIFPRASSAFIKANEAVLTAIADDIADKPAQVSPAKPRRGVMNKTETEFAMILERQKRDGEILSYHFEGITLRWHGIKFTPDFVVFPPAIAVSGQVKFIEVKGAFVKGKFERAVERFRHAKTYWPQFQFELWQKKGASWTRLL